MANWIPVSYAVTGSKDEREDLLSKIRECEQKTREIKNNNENETVDFGDLAKLLGSNVNNSDLMGYWYCANQEYDSIEQKATDDGEEYFTWRITNKYWENPKVREVIEGAYKTIKFYYDAPAGDTNDKEYRYFQPRVKLTKINGLNYMLGGDGTAILHCDDSIKGKVLRIPEQVDCGGKSYTVTGFGDCWADPQYGSPTKAPKELEEIFFPATIKEISSDNVSLPTLKAIHFAGDIDCIGEYAFSNCTQLTTVEFGGKVGIIDYCAFQGTAIKDIKIPDGTKVDPDAFSDMFF